MRKPFTRDESSKKEIKYRDDHLRRESYYREKKIKFKPLIERFSKKQAPYKSEATTEVERAKKDLRKAQEEIKRLTKEH